MDNKLKELALQVLNKAHVMSLATVNEAGPWVSDVIYVFDDEFNLYWISDIDKQHSISIHNDPRVSASITARDGADGSFEEALQIQGIAERIEGTLPHMAALHRKKRNKDELLPGEDIIGNDESWYCLRPTRIEIIYGELFGWKRQTLKK
jgi:uncharacterized protein YhbP (UPF0306 family)